MSMAIFFMILGDNMIFLFIVKENLILFLTKWSYRSLQLS